MEKRPKLTKEEYNKLPLYTKSRIDPIFICNKTEEKDEIVEEVIVEKEVEIKKDEINKYSYTNLKDSDKKEQVKILKGLGLDYKNIKDLKKEEDRIQTILNLQEEFETKEK